jgi:hypothetical protein
MPSQYILSRSESFRIYGPQLTRRVFGPGVGYIYVGRALPRRVLDYRDDQQAEKARFVAEASKPNTRRSR